MKASPGQVITFSGASLVEGDVVKISGDFAVAKCDSDEMAIGIVVVASDSFDNCSVLINKPLLEVVTTDALTAGDLVQASAEDGEIEKHVADQVAVGICIKGAGSGSKVVFAMFGKAKVV